MVYVVGVIWFSRLKFIAMFHCMTLYMATSINIVDVASLRDVRDYMKGKASLAQSGNSVWQLVIRREFCEQQ